MTTNDSHQTNPPIPGAYWVDPGRLMAGPYPGHADHQEAKRRVDALLELGIRRFVSLLAPNEEQRGGFSSTPIKTLVQKRSQQRGIQASLRSFPIFDMGTPSIPVMRSIQAALDPPADDPEAAAYVFCKGGLGRTGTVVGVYLLTHGLATAHDFVQRIAGLRGATAAGRASPESKAQIAFVEGWARLL